MPIVPAPVIDPNPSFFVGTGDGSNGSWTRPLQSGEPRTDYAPSREANRG
jgi:hypothetical protein